MRVRHRRLLLSLVDVLPCWFTDLSGPGLPSFFHSLTFDGIIIIVILCIQPPLETRFSLSIAQPTADVSLVTWSMSCRVGLLISVLKSLAWFSPRSFVPHAGS